MENAKTQKSEVVSLWPNIAPPVPTPQPELVELFERLLREAKDGSLTGIAYAKLAVAGGIATGWMGKVDRHLMVAAVRILDGRLMQAYLKEDE